MSASPIHGWELSRPAPDDAETVLALIRACDVAESGEPDTDLEDVLHNWRLIDRHRDAWLARESSGALMGYAAVIPQARSLRIDLYTHPSADGHALSPELLGLCEARAAQVAASSEKPGIDRMVTYVLHSNTKARRLFRNAGFDLARYILQMQREMRADPGEPTWPEGIQVRAFQVGLDEVETYNLVQETFDRPGRQRPSLQDWKEHLMRPESFDPSLWQLAFTGDELVGFCLAFEYPEEGWVRQLGVRESWRKRGLGAALLRDACRRFFALGKTRVGLTVESDNPSGLAFYRRLGMTVRRRYDEFSKQFPTGPIDI